MFSVNEDFLPSDDDLHVQKIVGITHNIPLAPGSEADFIQVADEQQIILGMFQNNVFTNPSGMQPFGRHLQLVVQNDVFRLKLSFSYRYSKYIRRSHRVCRF